MESTALFVNFMAIQRIRMKRAIFLFIVMATGTLYLEAQSFMIQGTIEDAEEGQIYLASYYGDRFRIVDTMESSAGFFYFIFPKEASPGIYRIIYTDRVGGIRSENRFVEFVYNRENIELVVTTGEQGPVPQFENTLENLVYNLFMEFELDYESKVMAVYSQLFSSDTMKGVKPAAAIYDTLQVQRDHFMDSVSTLYPGLYSIRLMNAFRTPFTPGAMSHQQRIDTLKESFFNHAPIDDPSLLYAPVYSYKLIDYLSLYKVDTFSQQEQEGGFIEAVDRIMDHVSPNYELRSFVVNFLLEGFESLGMEQVQLHLAENYLEVACESDVAELVRQRMEGYERMSSGRLAPDFVVRDVLGVSHQLALMDHDYVAVLFWASSCEHCREMLPELHAWYQQQRTMDMEVVAISMDSSVADFGHYMEELNPTWITVHDPLGWDGKTAREYFVYATPSLFLLDRDRIILAKPANYQQFIRAVRRLEVK
jgi:thiol-disulfide isomerase/thioredoxin